MTAQVDRAHVAGPMMAGLQACSRCGGVLLDRTHESAAYGEVTRSWPEGGLVEVTSGATSFVAAAELLDLPLCGSTAS